MTSELLLPKELQSESTSKLLGDMLIRLLKQDILARYKETREVTDEDWEFCEASDWHPVDELPPKPEHVEELKKALKEEPIEYNSVDEFFEKLDSK